MIDFFVSCIPPKTSHHRKRIVRVGKFSKLADSDALNAAKATLDAVLAPHRPAQPIVVPVRLVLTYVWPWLAGDPQRTRRRGQVWHPKRPDLSNLTKSLEDRLVALGFLLDDGLVVEATQRKFRGDRPGIRVQLEAAGEEPYAVHATLPVDKVE